MSGRMRKANSNGGERNIVIINRLKSKISKCTHHEFKIVFREEKPHE